MKFVIVLLALVGICAAAPKSLQDDFRDILNVLPTAEMRAVARKYLQNDAEFQRVVRYLQGPEWAALVADVASKPSYQSLKSYLVEAGIDVDAIVKFLHDLIQGAEVPTGASNRSMREFLDEIKALIDTEALLKVFNDKLQNSVDFQDFFIKISSEKGKALFEEVRALPEVQRIAGILKGMGVDLDKVLDVIYTILGWA